MPRFEPFRGLRYDTDRFALADVTAPPYDVINATERIEIGARSPYNVVHIDLPLAGSDADGGAGLDKYENGARILRQWMAEGALLEDDEPSFYVYRMGYHDEAGRARQTSGVIGALELMPPGAGDVLPHERTTPKDKTDRLSILRASHANLSPIWGLSLTRGLSALCELPGPPIDRWTDEDGVHHRLYRVSEAGTVAAISEAVAASPVVIADGHHRYETQLAYRDEYGAAHGPLPGAHDLAMALVVELAPDQLSVRGIHRLLSGVADRAAFLAALDRFFDRFPTSAPDDRITAEMEDAGGLALLTADERWILRPRPEAFAGVADLDTARLDAALATIDSVQVRYQHGVGYVRAALAAGEADAAVLCRPVTVEQIAATAHGGALMPPKSTFFTPKPRTGLVLRPLD